MGVAQSVLKPHPHIAEFADENDSARNQNIKSKSWFRCNIPNGAWDNGEGFAGPFDTGGYFGFTDGSNLQVGNIVERQGWEDWDEDNGALLRHYVGYFAGGFLPLPTTPPPINQAGFEIFGPTQTNLNRNLDSPRTSQTGSPLPDPSPRAQSSSRNHLQLL